MTKESIFGPIVLMSVFLLVACNAHLVPGQVAPTPTSDVLADCFQSATVTAWLDENGDGVRGVREPPLHGIEFVLEPSVYSRATSDKNGIASIFATTPGGDCPENQRLYPSRPDGYKLTTPESLAYKGPDAEYSFGFQSLPAPVLVKTQAYTGAIFTDITTKEFVSWFGIAADTYWMPTEEDVANLENGLTTFLKESNSTYQDTAAILERLPDYTRQYFGLVRANEELIYANFFCGGETHDWLETPVVVDDGGNCYFQVLFNAEANTYLSLSVNGES